MTDTDVHICANADWGGAETRALAGALASGDGAVVVCAASAAVEVRERLSAAGVTVVTGKFTGVLAALNLSRIFRHLPPGSCNLLVHSPQVLRLVEKSVELTGRHDLTVRLCDAGETALPPHPVTPPRPDATPELMWLGRITADCGLAGLIEALGRLSGKSWRLKVVGRGAAKDVMPLVNRTRALGIAGRVEWLGYISDVYAAMNGISLGVVTRSEPMKRTVTAEFTAASVPVICCSDAASLYQELSNSL